MILEVLINQGLMNALVGAALEFREGVLFY